MNRAELPSTPTQPHEACRQMEKTLIPGAGGVAVPPGTILCTENKFFWYQLKFGRKWLLGGRKLDSAHISPGRGAGEQLSGVKQSKQEAGPTHPIPDSAKDTAHLSWSFGTVGGRRKETL